ncbi:DNA-directed RNA polymerase I subunit rpa49 [Coemansia sp. RSA 2322]|uniref:DNA-directed RNA polymerase I subunit rpa49 n=1 Tax=Coemansia thaxteri TaxID=2663907 RepID=A0A9W8EH88_9FUNG|nr:DNA-directed RNA polymerase I subunit rpa49 [Coemansia thaxteri]KAJ2473414.1 DNA-directed RNA polymerase I subunit rpa49 [Coemansia sp. RSA 2322]KAJ2485898.1 DNA-directed RNA polymerase I subunit rpa49 [Coemansia sp. RSA 2320]
MPAKRKQSKVNGAASETRGQQISVSIDSTPANIQPVLATFTAGAPPVASSFATYRYISNTKNDDCIVVSETDKIEYVGQNFEHEKPLTAGCKYLVGVYDPEKDTVVFRVAPYVRVNTVIKSLKNSRGVAERRDAHHMPQARNELGVEFGSKKQRAGIRAEERNKINMDTVKGDMDVIGASIELRASTMPTTEEIARDNEKMRPVPKYDPAAETAAQIYDMEDLLSTSNAAYINAMAVVNAPTPDEYKDYVPVSTGFVAKKIEQIVAHTKPDLTQLRRVMYLAYLMRFATVRHRALQSRETCAKTLCCSPEIAAMIFEKFTDCIAGSINPDGSPVYTKTPANDSKLMCHICVLMLSLNNWVLYPAEVAADLALDTRKTTKYLESVGCKMEPVGGAASKGAKKSQANSRRAVLRAPIQFPKASLRGKK